MPIRTGKMRFRMTEKRSMPRVGLNAGSIRCARVLRVVKANASSANRGARRNTSAETNREKEAAACPKGQAAASYRKYENCLRTMKSFDRRTSIQRVPRCLALRLLPLRDQCNSALIRRTPLEELCSFVMTNLPRSPVLAACGPPQISLL